MDKTVFSDQQVRLRNLLRDLRKEAGLRQIDLAVKLDEPQSFVSKYESGERRLDFIEIAEICKMLDFSLSEFVIRFEKSTQ